MPKIDKYYLYRLLTALKADFNYLIGILLRFIAAKTTVNIRIFYLSKIIFLVEKRN